MSNEDHKTNTKLPILCLDFDGVIHSYNSGWQGAHIITDPMVPGTELFLRDAVKKFDVAIFSSRSHQDGGLYAMRSYIQTKLRLFFSREMADFIFSRLDFPFVKPPAFVTLDDRALQFTGVWPDVNELLTFKPWNKK